MTARRLARFKAALDRRQPDLTVVMDGVHKPHNFSAILRTCDAVGVHRAHIVPRHASLPLVHNAAQGSEKWVAVQRHESIVQASRQLRSQGFRIYAAHLTKDARDYREVDLASPAAIVLGTEKFGLDAESLEQVDQAIAIPMHGLVQSLNVSVAAALVLFEAQRQRLALGLYERRRLADDEFNRTLFRWLHPKVAAHCDSLGEPYPPLAEDGAVLARDAGGV